jgi:hypothetical protein
VEQPSASGQKPLFFPGAKAASCEEMMTVYQTTQCHMQLLAVYCRQQNVHNCVRQYPGSVARHQTDTVNCMLVYLSVRVRVSGGGGTVFVICSCSTK